MTVAILSFDTRSTQARVRFRCERLHIDEQRLLEPDPPFARWIDAYARVPWHREALLDLGLAIGRWFDGHEFWLARLAAADAPVTLVIETAKNPDALEQAVLDVPWELIVLVEDGRSLPAAPTTFADIDWQHVRHAALDPSVLLRVVRRIGPSATSTELIAPSKYRLSVVYVTSQPDGTELAIDPHGIALRALSSDQAIHVAIEDIGGLGVLGAVVARLGGSDVIHLSCPVITTPHPAVMLEDSHGKGVNATAGDLRREIGASPRLLALSARAASGDAGANKASAATTSRVLRSLAADLCQAGWPAVVTMPSLHVAQADGEFTATLYGQLSKRVSLEEAFGVAREAAATNHSDLWHAARLLLGPGGGGPLVAGTLARPAWMTSIGDRHQEASSLQVERRVLRRVMSTLRGTKWPGVVVHGGGEPLRIAFASAVLRHLEPELRRVEVRGGIDVAAILRVLDDQLARGEVTALMEPYRYAPARGTQALRAVLRAIIEGPSRERGAGAFVFVWYDPEFTTADGAALFWAVLGAFHKAQTESRLLVVSGAPAPVVDIRGQPEGPKLWCERLAPDEDYAAPVQIAPTPSSRLRSRRRHLFTADLAIMVTSVALLVRGAQPASPQAQLTASTQMKIAAPAQTRPAAPPRPSPASEPGYMARFQATEVSLGIFVDVPDSCQELSAREGCAAPASKKVDPTPVKAFDLDRHETTNAEFSLWLNNSSRQWSVEEGVVKNTKHVPLLWITAKCRAGISITGNGIARPTDGSGQWPVACVTWYGAEMYCYGHNKRLPRESEWELAAKGAAERPFPWGGDAAHVENVAYHLSAPRAVGTSSTDVTPEGVYDLAGNVAEWVEQGITPLRVRGGSFQSNGLCDLLISTCKRMHVEQVSSSVGFRCASDVDGSHKEGAL